MSDGEVPRPADGDREDEPALEGVMRLAAVRAWLGGSWKSGGDWGRRWEVCRKGVPGTVPPPTGVVWESCETASELGRSEGRSRGGEGARARWGDKEAEGRSC